MIDVVFNDGHFLVVNKPSGMPLLRDQTGVPCLLRELKNTFERPRLMHRLDKGTSGLLLVALDADVQHELNRAFNARSIGEHYVCAVCGHIPAGRTLTINLPLTEGRKSRCRVAGFREEIRPASNGWTIKPKEGLPSITRVRFLAKDDTRSVVAVQPLTGRSHQIRVHLAWIGHAVVGDHLYGRPDSNEQRWSRLALHCHHLRVPGYSTFTAPVPDELIRAIH